MTIIIPERFLYLPQSRPGPEISWDSYYTLPSSFLPFPITLHFPLASLVPYPFLSLPVFPSSPLSFPPLPPFSSPNPARGLGEHCELPRQSGAQLSRNGIWRILNEKLDISLVRAILVTFMKNYIDQFVAETIKTLSIAYNVNIEAITAILSLMPSVGYFELGRHQ